MPEGARVFQVLERHGYQFRRGTLRKIGTLGDDRHPAPHAFQLIEQTTVFRQALGSWLVEQMLVLPIAQMPANVLPIFYLRLDKPQDALGDASRQFGWVGRRSSCSWHTHTMDPSSIPGKSVSGG